MKRSQVHTLDDLGLHLRRDQHRLVEFLTTMHYAVTNGLNLLQVLDATDLIVHQSLKNQLDTYRVLRHRFLNFHFLSVRQLNQQERVGQTDLLNAALGHNGLALHFKELVLDTATSAVQN